MGVVLPKVGVAPNLSRARSARNIITEPPSVNPASATERYWFRLCPSHDQRSNTPTNTRNNTHASITVVTVAIIEKRLKVRNGLHNIGNIAIKPYLMINKAIIMSCCKLSKREILFCLQCNATTEQCHYFVSCFECKVTIVTMCTIHMPRNIWVSEISIRVYEVLLKPQPEMKNIT